MNGIVVEGKTEHLTFEIFVAGGRESTATVRELLPAVKLTNTGRKTSLSEFAPGHGFKQVPAFIFKDAANGCIFYVIN